MRLAKSNFVHSLSKSPHSFWSYVRSLRKSKCPIPKLSSSDSSASSNSNKANLLNQAFTSFFSSDPTPLPDPSSLLYNSALIPDSNLCSQLKVLQLISALPLNTSPGPDGISSLLLKSMASTISLPLSLIFNQSITSGSLPSSWKHSTVSPIPKTSPPSSSPSEYCPISLLSIVSKLLEKHIFHIVIDHLYSNQLIPPNQFGFLPCHSTIDALISVSHSIFSSIDSSSSICGVFLDIKKAFDSVSHSLLLHKLHSISLPPYITLWFHSYLTGRSQSVKIGSEKSLLSPVTSGVPQGFILGLLLFIISFNDISSLLPSFSSRLFLYADDILLLHPVNSPQDCSSIKSHLAVISSWLSSHSLQINVQKSKDIFFSLRNRAVFDNFPPISVSGSTLERVFSYKYLGITLRYNMSWSSHINTILRRSQKLLDLIYRQFYNTCSPNTILSLYTTIVRPVLEYGSIIWDPKSTLLISSLQKVQHFALKIASKSWSSSSESLLSKFHLPTLHLRRTKAKLIQNFKLHHNISHSHNNPPLTLSYPIRCTRSSSLHNFSELCCRITVYLHSFYPSAIKQWNSLPEEAKSTDSLSCFKFLISSVSPNH